MFTHPINIDKLTQRITELERINRQLQTELAGKEQLAKALKHSKERYRAIAETHTELICRFFPDGTINFVNSSYCHYLGKSYQALIGTNLLEYMPEDEQSIFQAYLQSFIPAHPEQNYQRQVILSSGEIRQLDCTDRAFFNDQGKVIEFQSIGRDFTHNLYIKPTIGRKSEQFYRTIAKNFPQGAIVLFDRNLRYLLADGAGLADIGMTQASFEGKTIWEVFPPEVCQAIEPDYRAALAGEKTFNEVNFNQRIYLTNTVPVKNDQGQIVCGMVVTQDITDRKKIEVEIIQQRDFLNALIQTTSDGITVIDQDYNFLIYNQAMEKITGYSFADTQNTNLLSSLLPDREIYQQYLATMAASFQGNIVDNSEWEITRIDGDKRNILVSTRILKLGEISLLLSAVKDITQRKQVEQELKVTKERYELAIRASNDGFWDWDLQTGEVYFSPRWKEIISYVNDELLNKISGWEKVTLPEDLQASFAIVEDYNTRQIERFLTTKCFQHKNGKTFYMLSRAIHLKDAEGKLLRMVGAHTDVTELVNIQEELRHQKEILQTIFDHIPIMIVFYDRHENIQLINQALEKILGWSLQEYKTIDVMSKCYPDPNYLQEVLNFMREATGKWKDLKTYRRDGHLLETSWANIRLSDGTRIGIGQDITERKQVEEALYLQAQREKLTNTIAQKIRQSLELTEVLKTTVKEVQNLLQCDRVLLFRFNHDQTGEVVNESLGSNNINSWLQKKISIADQPNCDTRYQEGIPRIINEISVIAPERLIECSLEYLTHLEIKSEMIVPIFPKEHLWGLLIAQQCHQHRQWQPWELDLLISLANQVGIAIQQSELYQQLQAANQELQRLATVDGLTQVANRRYFDEYLHKEWYRLAREKAPLSLIICDVDFFKRYNDNYGHLQGDECLKKIAQAIANVLKRPADLVARYGGEEFVVVLPNTDLCGAIKVGELIQEAIKNLQMIHDHSPHKYVSISLGITTCVPLPNTLSNHIIANADRALYKAKAAGRNLIAIN